MEALQIVRRELGLERAGRICALWAEVWPRANAEGAPLEERAEALLADELLDQRMEPGSELFHVLEEEGQLLAVARSFVRKIRFEATGASCSVLALAGVCSSPSLRGRGLGKAVVLDAFGRLGRELDWCLFQTGVPEFYERLGACRVYNEFRDSVSGAGEESPWWDAYVMVKSVGRNWPAGRVDLCGVAY
ncbi:hypothetical protein [Pelagicoccus sp. SDUM812005]|uniref:hypothetical protein n=1 Tax=Pelagicoccus sp. SDUM812005 TaxID=3041257 RepID=UPI00280D5431|nr:hypothetical protein [Pelagicoccus sp. SDUM812005]MDQ8180062.1 hypothetical protein [Pelagicoccus sp. SDUM812005]